MMESKKPAVAILDMYKGAPNQGMRNIRQLVEQFQLPYTIFDVRQKGELPHPGAFDVYISTGGPGSPFDGLGEAWEKDYFHLIDKIVSHNVSHQFHKKHLFAICHSFQMLCRHFDLGKVCMRKSTSFGVLPTHKTEAGKHEAFFNGLDDVFYIVDSRSWQVISPNEKAFKSTGAKLLALEKNRPNIPLERAMMSIRFSEEIFMTQFHPEADPVGMMAYFQQEERRKAVIDEHGEAKYNDMLSHLNDPDKIQLTQQTIIPLFLHRVITQNQLIHS
jgi:GMP synthase-like glutamine amidotransferase